MQDLSGMNMDPDFADTEMADWAQQQAMDERDEMARVADCFKSIEFALAELETIYRCELTETRESIEFLKAAYYRR